MKLPSPALLRLGFRPFYLAAALFAALAIAWWWAEFNFGLARPAALPGVYWHSHEMVFGFAIAVVAGFLLTAAQTWTGVPTPSGWPLAALVAVWLAGRLAMWWHGPLTAWVDLLFLPLLAATLLRVLVKAGNKRNYFLVALLLALAACNVVFHASIRAWLAWPAQNAVLTALFILVMLLTVVGGRVMPMFTANAVAGVRQYKRVWLDRAAVALTAVGLILFVVQPALANMPPQVSALVLALAAVANAVRLLGWGALASSRKPILWILHVSYVWIPAGLLLLAASSLGWVGTSAAIHALAVGAVAAMMLGMMTRTSRGHTGLAMQAGPLEIAAYVSIHVAAVARVVAAFASEDAYRLFLTVASALWVLAFVLFVVALAPALVRPRVDGKPS